jgi:translation initiation factor 2B subunit (eIF-2B alpha/beta/delta family)
VSQVQIRLRVDMRWRYLEENDDKEVMRMWWWGESVEGVTVRNVYFEWVDGKFIEWYITEQGTLDQQKLKDIYLEREALKGVWNILG